MLLDDEVTCVPHITCFPGVAPGAKVAFFDIEDGSSGVLSVPSDLSSGLLSPLRDTGARVMSNSWGGGGYYTSQCYDVDSFSYYNPDSLVVFAAGNNGACVMSSEL